MKKIKKISCFICFGLVCILLMFGFRVTNKSKPVSAEDSVIPISRIQGSFAINVRDQRELVAFADYVFVGEVLKNEGYEYRYPVTGEDDNGNEITLTSPYTNYTVQVLDNIKGNLIMDKGIPIAKQGGLSQDGSYYEMFEDDELPVEKGIYIFYAYAQEDGSLLIAGPNSNIKIEVPPDYSDDKETPEGTNQNDEFVVDSGSEILESTDQNNEFIVDNNRDTPESTNQNEKLAVSNENEEFFRNTDIYKEVVDASNNQESVDVMEIERYISDYDVDAQ